MHQNQEKRCFDKPQQPLSRCQGLSYCSDLQKEVTVEVLDVDQYGLLLLIGMIPKYFFFTNVNVVMLQTGMVCFYNRAGAFGNYKEEIKKSQNRQRSSILMFGTQELHVTYGIQDKSTGSSDFLNYFLTQQINKNEKMKKLLAYCYTCVLYKTKKTKKYQKKIKYHKKIHRIKNKLREKDKRRSFQEKKYFLLWQKVYAMIKKHNEKPMIVEKFESHTASLIKEIFFFYQQIFNCIVERSTAIMSLPCKMKFSSTALLQRVLMLYLQMSPIKRSLLFYRAFFDATSTSPFMVDAPALNSFFILYSFFSTIFSFII